MPNNASRKSPLAQYQALVSENKIIFDASQQQAVELLEQLYLNVQFAHQAKAQTARSTIKGIYLWGKVGRGKTFLMDLFVNSLPSSLCKRQHFHHFMQDVHSQLRDLAGKSDPLKIIAHTFSQQYHVLCFDEFFVSDIGDAMLLGNLLQYLYDLKVVVVSTSNCAPHELYKRGVQRERFLMAIDAIEDNTQVLELTGKQDHRLRSLTYAQNYFELPKSAQQQMDLHQGLLNKFNLTLAEQKGANANNSIVILGRNINYIAKNSDEDTRAICFDFSALCEGPRSHFDYVEIAKQFSTILLYNVPPMSGQAYERIKARGTEDNGSNVNIGAAETGERQVMLGPMDDGARRFIALVDECYDRNINLLITAYIAQDNIYNSGALMFEFERAKSRLVEMASVEYFEKSQNTLT